MLVFDINRFGTKREIDDNGYLRVSSCNITKSQIRPYYGREIPGWRDFDLDADTIYNVYCPEEELKKALESFNNLPLTREHIEVDVENVPKDKIVGSLGDRAEYKKPYVKNSLIVYDKKDIDWILSGKKKELSCGYRYTPVRQSGEFDGKHYDFVMTDIIGNHVALVREGRAGHDVMVADESPNFTESQNDNTINTKENEMLANDEFKEADHPRDDSGRFTDKSGSSSGSSLKDDKDVENYWQNAGSKESQSAGVVKVMKKQLEDLKAEHKKIFGKPMFVSKEEQERGEMIGKQIKDLEEEIAKKESEGSEKKETAGKEVSMGERIGGLKDSLKSQLSKEITKDPKKLRELAKNDEALTRIAEVTNMGQGHLKNALNEMADELEGSEKKEESRGDLGSGSPRHIYGQKKDGSIPVALKITNYPNWNKVEVVKEFDKEEDALNYAEEQGEAVKSDYQNKTKNAEKYGIANWVTPKELEYIKEHSRFPDNESEEESSKETAVEKMYKKLSEQGMKGEALEQAIYEKHGWEGVEEARMISEYESGNPKHSQKEQEELVKSLEEELGDYKKIVKNFEDQGETGIDYNHYKQMVERQEGALKQAKSQLDWIKRHTKKEMAKDKEIPEKAGKPEKAGDEVALNQGETKMAEEVKEAPAEKKVEETKKEEVVEDACKKAEDKKEVKPACDEKEDKRKLIDEIGGILKGKLDDELLRTVLKKAEELAYNDSERSADDEKKDDLKGKEKEAFAEGVDFGEKKEKAEPKKLDSEQESEGMKKAEKEMAKDEGLTMDIDAIKAQVREEVMADFKAREEARKAVRGFVGDVNVMAFDSAEDIYKFACGKSGMDLNEIVSFKDAFKGLSAGKSKALALDASPVSGSNEECLKDIRIA